MMSIPPTGPSRPSSSEEPSGDNKKAKREFKLPDKKKEDKSDIGGEAVKEMKQFVSQEQKVAIAKIEQLSPSELKAQISQINQLILSTVESMRVGESITDLTLKAGQVPEYFEGGTLTLSYDVNNALIIHFDNIQQQDAAIALVEKNKEQLQQLVQALHAKNIQVAELSIGNHKVALPRVEPLPPPFQPPPSAEAETRQQRERGEEERGGEGGPTE